MNPDVIAEINPDITDENNSTHTTQSKLYRNILLGNLGSNRVFDYKNFYDACLPWDKLTFQESVLYLKAVSVVRENGSTYNSKEFISRTLKTLGLQNDVKLENIRIDDIVEAGKRLDPKDRIQQKVMNAICKLGRDSNSWILLESLFNKFYKNK